MDKSTQKRGRQQVCSFCGKGQGQVKHLIAGPDAYAGTPVYICDECVQACNAIVLEDRDAAVTASEAQKKAA